MEDSDFLERDGIGLAVTGCAVGRIWRVEHDQDVGCWKCSRGGKDLVGVYEFSQSNSIFSLALTRLISSLAR